MPPHCSEEEKEADEFQQARKWQHHAPMPSGHSGEPARGHPKGPKGPGCPAFAHREAFGVSQLGERVEADAQNERSHPAEDLRVAVRLQRGQRERAERLMARDADQVPNAKEGAWQQQEKKAASQECFDQMLALPFSANARLLG